MTKPFTLFITPSSPFARKCRIVARERGLMDRIEEIDAKLRTPANAVLAVSPLGKAPTLTGPDGLRLVDSSIISEYLDRLDGAPELHPDGWAARWRWSDYWALAEGLLESLAWRTREFRRPPAERSPSFIAYEGERQARVYDWLEANVPATLPRSVADIALAIALDYAIYRFPEEDWRRGRPKLAAWFAQESAKDAFQATLLPLK